jgi:chitodextrinase
MNPAPARVGTGGETGRRRALTPPRLALVIGFIVTASGLPLATPAQATSHCATSGPGSYTVTVCIDQPAEGATLVGTPTVIASVSFTGAPPNVRLLQFDLGAAYLLSDFASPYQFKLPTTRWVDGSYDLSAKVVMTDGFASSPASVTVTFDNGITEPPVNTGTFEPRTGTSPPPGTAFTVAAVADGASGEASPAAVSDLISSWGPNMVLYMGDVYNRGSPAEFLNWFGEPTTLFGRFRDITNPAPGNHEWDLGPGAPGYVDYWDNIPHYYSVDAAGWHIVSFDSDPRFNGTQPGSAQYQWLDQDLAASPAMCTLVIAHHPRYSVGQHADNTYLSALWSLMHQRGVDIVLFGHDHDYQRWLALDGQGALQAGGMTEFVVGTGGHSVYAFTRTDTRLAAGFDTSPQAIGALRLELNPQGAAFRYVSTSLGTLDSGSVPCREAPADGAAPTVPTNLQASAPSPTRVDLSWTASTDNVGVTGYDVYRGGQLLQSIGPQTTYADLTVSPGTQYSYTVRARDAAGNISGHSNTATVTTPGASLVFSDGFESGTMSNWTTVTNMTVQSGGAHTGTYAARAQSTGPTAANAVKNLASTYPELYERIWFKVVSRGSNSVTLLRFQTAGGANILTLFVSSSDNLMLRNDVGGSNLWSPTVVTHGVWHEVQVRVLVAGASSQTAVWYDGQPVSALTQTLSLGSNPVGRLMLGENVKPRTYEVLFDDVAASTSFISGSDTQPPTAPTNLQASAPSPTRVDLSWTASTDNVGVTGYDVYRGGQLLQSIGPQTTYADLTVSPGTQYSYTVRARDAAGNISGHSNTATVTTPGASLVFSDGFESGTMSNWTTVTNMTVQSGGAHTGTYAARAQSTGPTAANAVKNLASTYPELYERIWFKVVSRGSNSVTLLRFQTAGGANILTLFVSSSDNLMLRNDVGGSNLWSPTVVTHGVWHEVQVRVLVAGASSQTAVWYDGQPVSALTQTLSLGSNPVGRLMLGENVKPRTYEVLFDDVAASTSFIS